MISLPPLGIASRELSARLSSAVASWLGSTVARQVSSSKADSIWICSPSVGRKSLAVSIISVLTSTPRGCSGLRAPGADSDLGRLQRRPPGECEQMLRELGAAPRRLVDHLGDSRKLRLLGYRARQDLDRAGNDGQDIVEVVGDAAGQLA